MWTSQQTEGSNKIPLDSMAKTVNTCEAHIRFTQNFLTDELTYDSCINAFQSITVECMKIGSGKYAKEGRQAGVLNMIYDPNGAPGCSGNPIMKSSNSYNLEPGYTVGPPGFFGDICGVDPTEVRQLKAS